MMNRSNFIRNSLMSLAITLVPEILRPMSNPIEKDVPGIDGEEFKIRIDEQFHQTRDNWLNYAEFLYMSRWYDAIEHSMVWGGTPEYWMDKLHGEKAIKIIEKAPEE